MTTNNLNKPESMAEDELLNIGEILLRYRNYLYEDDREILGGMLSAKEAEQAMNAYTTNKINEAKLGGFDKPSDTASVGGNQVGTLSEAIQNVLAEHNYTGYKEEVTAKIKLIFYTWGFIQHLPPMVDEPLSPENTILNIELELDRLIKLRSQGIWVDYWIDENGKKHHEETGCSVIPTREVIKLYEKLFGKKHSAWNNEALNHRKDKDD